MTRSRVASRCAALVAAALLGTALVSLSACTGAPVQEMSDARQAIAAARAAGAAERAPEQFAQATNSLSRAEAALQRHDYGTARSQAALARTRALEALRLANRDRARSDSP